VKMKGEHTTAGEVHSDLTTPSESAAARPRSSKRRSAPGISSNGSVRFFLSKDDSNGPPSLDREFGKESEAIVESLKTGKSYFVISEWKGLADLSKKIPLIRKEAISNKKQKLE